MENPFKGAFQKDLFHFLSGNSNVSFIKVTAFESES